MKNIFIILLLLLVSACSNSPSDSEIKQAIFDSYSIKNCKPLKIYDFNKINAFPGKDGVSYNIVVKFTFKMDPVFDWNIYNKDMGIYKSKWEAKLNERLNEIRLKYKDYERPTQSNLEGDIFHANRLANQEILSFSHDYIRTEISKSCEYLGVLKYDIPANYNNGLMLSYQVTVPLIKTDGGWREKYHAENFKSY